MAENPNQPRDYDATIGGQNPLPLSGAILGGLAGVKRCLASELVEQRIAALQEALNYEQEGLELVIEALKDSNKQVQWVAYSLLQNITAPLAQKASRSFNPYPFFECIETLAGGHSNYISCVAISPNGEMLATCSPRNDGTIKLWNLHTGKLQRTLEPPDGASFIAFSPDGQILASNGLCNAIHLWNFHTGQLERTLEGNSGWVNRIVFSPDGQILATTSFHKTETIHRWNLHTWNLHTGELQRTFEGLTNGNLTQNFNCIAISPDGQILASGSNGNWRDNRTIQLWNLHTGELQRTLEHSSSDALSRDVNSVVFTPDGQTLASGGSDGIVKLWNVYTGKLQRTLGRPSGCRVRSLAISPDGQILVSGGDQTYTVRSYVGFGHEYSDPVYSDADGYCESYHSKFKLWFTNLHTGEERTRETQAGEGNLDQVQSVAISPDGQMLATSIHRLDFNHSTIRLWNLHTSELLPILAEHSEPIESVAISPDGQILASGSHDSTIKLWNLHTGRLQRTLWHSGYVTSVAVSPNGEILASGGWDETIKLWNLHTGELQHTLEGHTARVNSITFSPDGQTLVSGSGTAGSSYPFSPHQCSIKLWSVHTGQLIRTLEGHSSGVTSVAINPYGEILASGSWDKTIKLWNLHTGELQRVFEHSNSDVQWKANVHCVVFPPDGQTLVSSGSDEIVKLWNLYTGELQRTFQSSSSVASFTISPDGQILAGGCYDNTIKLWDLYTGELLHTLVGHSNSRKGNVLNVVNTVAFSPDGEILASGSTDQTIKLWGVP